MTAPEKPLNTIDIRGALARADTRHARRAGHNEPLTPDHLDALTEAVRPLVEQTGTPTDTEATIARQHGEITSLRLERDQLVEELTATRRDTQHRVDTAVHASKTIIASLCDQIENLRIDLTAARIHTATPHRCRASSSPTNSPHASAANSPTGHTPSPPSDAPRGR